MINPTLQRALLLHQQGRTADAERELRQSLSDDPHHWYPHTLLALCLADQNRFQEATAEAAAGISLDAEQSFAHYAMASVMRQRRRYGDAQEAIKEAIRLDSFDPDNLAMLAQIRFEQNAWPSALDAAERALQLDAEHIAATNLRAMALVKLGRRDEANASLHGALARAPEDATTHSNQGWSHLHAGEHRQALEHFREALRLDPESEWAKAGVVEALKSRYFVYRWLLRYSLWMARLSSGGRWGIIIGGYLLYRLMNSIAAEDSQIAVYLQPLLVAYLCFAVLTWFAPTLFDLLLQFNRFGRLALRPEKRIASLVAGALLLGGGISAAMFFFADSYVFFPAIWVCVLMVVPVTSIPNCERGWPRAAMYCAAGVVLALGASSIALAWQNPNIWRSTGPDPLGVTLLIYFIYGILALQFLSMYLSAQQVRR